jgi:hypothetical protein
VMNAPTPVIVDGMLTCPKKKGASMARDACVKEQARCGLGCGFFCPKGVVALREAAAHLESEGHEEQVREAVRERHRQYYQQFKDLPSQQYRPTGRPRGRPRRPRPPVPGGTGPRSPAR